jgi:hypothetical protein
MTGSKRRRERANMCGEGAIQVAETWLLKDMPCGLEMGKERRHVFSKMIDGEVIVGFNISNALHLPNEKKEKDGSNCTPRTGRVGR